MSLRAQKVANEIRKALSLPMDDFARQNGGGLLTITNVIMSPDLSIAKVYLSVFASKLSHEEIVSRALAESFRFKRAITTQLRLRIVPELRFYIDSSLDEVERIDSILKSNPPFHAEDETTGNEDTEPHID